jgi:hypothetical protein
MAHSLAKIQYCYLFFLDFGSGQITSFNFNLSCQAGFCKATILNKIQDLLELIEKSFILNIYFRPERLGVPLPSV